MKHRLVEIRKKYKLSQTEMGEIMGLGLRGYQYIEHGERDLAPRHIRAISQHLGIPESEFFESDEPPLFKKLRMLNEKQQAAFENMIDAMIKEEKK